MQRWVEKDREEEEEKREKAGKAAREKSGPIISGSLERLLRCLLYPVCQEIPI